MLRTPSFKIIQKTGTKICMSTSSQERKLEHYKNLQALQDAGTKPIGWDEAKPFESLPGPKPLPLFGNFWRFAIPKFGEYYQMDILDIHKNLIKTYGDILILKGLPRDDIVMMANPKDFETLFRNEGIWPIRKNLPAFDYYSKSNEHKYPNFGLVGSHGEDWFKLRSQLNPVLMKPQNIIEYVDKMNVVADEFVDNIDFFSKQNSNGEMPNDFQNEVYKWALESVGTVTLDAHLGCLKRDLDKNSESQNLINNILDIFKLTYKLDILPSAYKYVSTPNWRKFVSVLDFVIETNIKHITRALNELDNEATEGQTKSILKQLLKKDRNLAVGMAIDMMFAGVDTTGRILGAGIYFLAKNPKQQEKLRNEAMELLKNKNSPITKETLSNAPYLKAAVKEVTRLAPIGIGNLRTTVKDLVLGGYQIPKGTDVLTSNLILCLDDENFPKAKEFLPERWLSKTNVELSHRDRNPFIFAPFGYGPRSCIGKRLATLEIEVALLKIIRNFELSWPHKDMKFVSTTLYGLADPLKVHVKPITV